MTEEEDVAGTGHQSSVMDISWTTTSLAHTRRTRRWKSSRRLPRWPSERTAADVTQNAVAARTPYSVSWNNASYQGNVPRVTIYRSWNYTNKRASCTSFRTTLPQTDRRRRTAPGLPSLIRFTFKRKPSRICDGPGTRGFGCAPGP
jgi:hypothetical protein